MRRLLTPFLILFSSIASPQEIEIYWLQSDAPPFHFPAADHGGQNGLCDKLVDELIRLTPQFQHIKQTLPQARIGRYFREGKNACFPCMIFQPQRQSLALQSEITAVYPPLAVITDRQRSKEIIARHGEPVNLRSLLNDDRLVYGQSVARKFSKEIQALREAGKPKGKSALNYRANDQAEVLGELIASGRIDYGIDYPFVKDYFNTKHNDNLLQSIAIEGYQEKLVHGAIGCAALAENQFAEKVLSTINPLLREKILPSATYREHQAKWLGRYFEDFPATYRREVLKQRNEVPKP